VSGYFTWQFHVFPVYWITSLFLIFSLIISLFAWMALFGAFHCCVVYLSVRIKISICRPSYRFYGTTGHC
jgi:hypothetical protein